MKKKNSNDKKCLPFSYFSDSLSTPNEKKIKKFL